MSWWRKRKTSAVWGTLHSLFGFGSRSARRRSAPRRRRRSAAVPAALVVVLVVAAGAAAVAAAAARSAVVERIRYVGTVRYSRVVIDLSAPARHEILQVPGDGVSTPVNRLVVDFAGAKIGPEAKEPLNVGDALLQRIRTGQFTSDRARVVLDFRSSAEHRAFALEDPYRLVIDMHGGVDGAPGGEGIRRLDTASVPSGRETKAHLPPAPPPAAPPPVARVEPQPAPPPPAPGPATVRSLRVVIDPGHGGKDPGARGFDGLLEKEVVLEISRDLATRLRMEPGIDVRMTRDDDRTLSLEERTALANAAEADLFISVHANASAKRSTRGIEIYYLNNTNNRGTLRLAAMENGIRWNPGDRSLQTQIPDLDYILSDLRQTYKVEESRVLADHLGGAIVTRLQGTWEGVSAHEVREGPFYVLVGAYMPCVLVEVSYLTHPVEGRRLARREYRSALAEGILDGIRSYVRETRMAKNL